MRELHESPEEVCSHILEVPEDKLIVIEDSPEAYNLADAYLGHGVIGPGSRADALHFALASISKIDVLVSWNFKHIVNLGWIRLINAMNLEQGIIV